MEKVQWTAAIVRISVAIVVILMATVRKLCAFIMVLNYHLQNRHI